MQLPTHNAGGSTAGPEAGARQPRTPGRTTRCVCGGTALGGDAAVRNAGRRSPGGGRQQDEMVRRGRR